MFFQLYCYHCGTTIVGAKLIGQQHGVSVRRMDFCDSQAGKGTCDRKAATIKSNMKIFLNSRKNIESAEEMKNAILSSGGVPSVTITVSGPPKASTFSTVWLEGVSTISNISTRHLTRQDLSRSPSCTTTRLSKLITECLKLVRSHCTAYCKAIRERTGVNSMWIIINSLDVTRTLEEKQLSLTHVST